MKKMTAAVLGLAVISTAAFAKVKSTSEIPHKTGEVIVKVKAGKMGKFLAQRSILGVEVVKKLDTLAGQFLVLKASDRSSQILINQIKDMPEVAYAEPNLIYKAISSIPTIESMLTGVLFERKSTSAPQDPLYGKLWGLNNTGSNEPAKNGDYSGTQGVSGADVDAEAAWEITKGSRKVLIAVVDTGIDYNHPDLVNNIWTNPKEVSGNGIDDDRNGYIDDVHGWNAQSNNGNPMDGNSHGTHCAGTIGAEHNNGVGVAGVMAEVSLMAVKFLGDDGSGNLADAVEAIDYATKMNVDIMSNSWGGGGFSQALEDSIKAAKNKGIVFIAAAGNDGDNNDSTPHYPANYQVDNVISVASHTVSDSLSSFSCYGKRTVHVAAPGSNVLSSVPNEGYKVYSGTSMATPHVSGVVGLLLSHEGRLPVLDVRNRLMATTNPSSSYRRSVAGGGRVSAYNLLTDTRIPRDEPNESAWRRLSLNEVFESTHPYKDNERVSKTFSFPGARYVKLVIEKYEVETNYDFLKVLDASGSVVEKLTGKGEKYKTEYVESDSITLEFSSDSSQARWGYLVREAEVIY